MDPVTHSAYRDIPISSLVESKWNPRKHYDTGKLEELAESIRQKGIIEPIVVRANGKPDMFEILAGSRRFRASKLAGLTSMPSVVRVIDDTAALELAVIENGQREDVHPLDEAEGYKALLKADKHYTVAVVAAKVGKSESYVYRRLKLLELEQGLLAALAEDRLSVAHAEKLLRLTPKLRAIAADPVSGVVWRESPLFAEDTDWIPQREDLRPLHELESFIRTRSHFDPSHRDVKHFQPELAAAIADADAPAAAEATEFGDDNRSPARLVELSLDPLARNKLGAAPNDPIPLTPSKWREVKGPKDRCPHTIRGVITHGGESRVLDVCTKKSCPRHFPPTKRTKDPRAAQVAASGAERRARQQQEDEKRRADEQQFKAMAPALCLAMAAHLARVKVNAAFVRSIVDSYRLQNVKRYFHITLTDATAAQVLALVNIPNPEYRYHVEQAAKTWDFDLKAFQRAWQAGQDAKGKAALKAGRADLKAKTAQ
ncbi:MAG: ParB/RepB/Spo0J family partition protein [Acidobacteriota bacterium]